MCIKTDPAIGAGLGQWSEGGLVTLVPLIPPQQSCSHLLCAAGKADGLPELPKNQVPVSP